MLLLLAAMVGVAQAQSDDFSSPPINYMTAEVHDAVAELSRAVDAGDMQLEYDGQLGYLPSVLEALDISIESQTLVFSKTSMQRHRISTRRPRAIYFNDDVYIGFCQNGEVLEFAATDPVQGAIFYTLDQSRGAPPKFLRDQGQCLTCHASSRTQNVPGYMIRSVFADASGMPEFGNGTFNTDHTSPLNERWGGWYVTGTHGSMRHMGNATFDKDIGQLDRETHANLQALKGLVSTNSYLSNHSDIVALMVLEHQTQTHNAIAWASYETRRAIYQSHSMNEALDRPEGFLSESSQRRIDRAADRILQYFLMADEFPLTDAVSGTSGYAAYFQSLGPRDSKGRSLRDLDLKTRMFQYPCSYLIYSDAFDALPDEVGSLVLAKLDSILSQDALDAHNRTYAHLAIDDRRAILEILLATKPQFAAAHAKALHEKALHEKALQ